LMLFSPLEWFSLGNSTEFFLLLAMRLVQAALLLGLFFMTLTNPTLALSGWPLTFVCLTGMPLFWVVPIIMPEAAVTNFAIIIVLLITMYVFLPNRLVLINLIAACGILGALGTIWWLGVSGIVLVALFFCLLLPTVLGYATALRIQSTDRRAFALLTEMKQANTVLEQEIERRQVLEVKLEQQALTDPLTGLCNRRHYEAIFMREFERCRRHGADLVVGMIDLDHFKVINDTYGHDFGDEVLKFVAKVLQSPLRRVDVLGRFGGEEFILLLPDTSLEEGQAVAERMRTELEEATMLKDGKPVRITATFALTLVNKDDNGIQDSIRRADEALYEGKRNGRNCVMTARAA
jgi:diguanylate cyclase